MRVFGLTGGIATGKSTAVKYFKQLDPEVVVFDADACVKELYERREVIEAISALAGGECVGGDGRLDRDVLRGRLFAESGLREQIQSIVHPLVRKECLASLERSAMSVGTSSFIADVPLLFEGGFDFGQDANLVVAVRRETQVQRLIMRNGFDDVTVQAILEAQLPISEKQKCADVVFWNEGSEVVLRSQIQRFIENKYR
ncbi:dephospho-CoA kinase [Rubritalea tangerina]|uniref:Dephospho-CoA kinase n=1 Tax=Rubritalea tangerina TaxID=430798 RepID=A0ABW4ZEK1_9BACT